MERESHKEADERREAVMASAATLRPNFKLKSGMNESQLSKFQELHRRRLQIKAKSKIHKRDKDANGKGKSHKMAVDIQESADHEPSKTTADSTSACVSSQEDNVTKHGAAKIRQKLFWGLDTKERWERKSVMEQVELGNGEQQVEQGNGEQDEQKNGGRELKVYSRRRGRT